ncbi:MAG TPA: hypothetical protein VF834_22205 [Streptosporangiaceae bacterium]
MAGVVGQQAAVWGTWARMPLSGQREVLRTLVKSLVLLPVRDAGKDVEDRVQVEWHDAPSVPPTGPLTEPAPAGYVAPTWAEDVAPTVAGQ